MGPLDGIKVLELAGIGPAPFCCMLLSDLGADVVRIDRKEPIDLGVAEDPRFDLLHRGRQSIVLNLKNFEDLAKAKQLVSKADVLVEGFRPGVMERLGLGPARRRALRPGLVDVCLDAYGWTGPWRTRRGFDSLVQMSSGIADAGTRRLGKDKPFPLPVQALDHACGYAMATAALRGLTLRLQTGQGSASRLSLARIAALLTSEPAHDEPLHAPETPGDLGAGVEATGWGAARRIRSPVVIGDSPLSWTTPSGPLGAHTPEWTV